MRAARDGASGIGRPAFRTALGGGSAEVPARGRAGTDRVRAAPPRPGPAAADLSRVDLLLARSLLVLAEERSFTAAAHRLHLSPSAVSKQIRRLERLLGAPMIDRSRRPLALTADGRVVVSAYSEVAARLTVPSPSGTPTAAPGPAELVPYLHQLYAGPAFGFGGAGTPGFGGRGMGDGTPGPHPLRPVRPTARWPGASLLGRLPAELGAELAAAGTGMAFKAGRAVVRRGDTDTSAYLLLSGSVKVTGNEGGREPLLAVRVGGDLVGEMAALTGGPRSATVTAAVDIAARRLSADTLRAFLLRHPTAAVELAAVTGSRLSWANERRIDFAALDPPARLGRVIASLADTYGHDTAEGRTLGVSLTQEELAMLAGMRLPTAAKILRRLQRDGILRLGYRTLVVVDPAALPDGPSER